jgi:demethylmenaquinone methyltransferase/2-methoxy-6-polyprenyl-1,4-benzoquinol methylase
MAKTTSNGNSEDNQSTVAFGYRAVAPADKQKLVNQVFTHVAERYDQMNDLLSAGLHRLWKDDLVALLNPPRTARAFRVLDVAGGTGDVAFRIARAGGAGTNVIVADISPAMMAEGRARAQREGLGHRCRFAGANAEALPFPDRSFEAYAVAFGIRNMSRVEVALSEAYRVLKPGGRFVCLEFSDVDVPGLSGLYDAYSFTVMPALGQAVTGNGAAYRYLAESIRTFPCAAEFTRMIGKAGFARVMSRKLAGGIVAIHSAWRL